jgi:hypothetical protein
MHGRPGATSPRAPERAVYETWDGKENKARPFIVANVNCPAAELPASIKTLLAFGIGREEIGSALALLGKEWPC